MAHQCAYEDDGIRCENDARRKYCEIHKGMSNALKQRAYRERKADEKAKISELAAVSDTPLARKALGLPPKDDDDVTVRFASRHDDAPLVDFSDPNFRGIAGLSERVESPYGVEARRAAQEAERLDDVVDYSRGSGHVPPAQRDRSRRERLLRRLTNAERRDAVVREAKLRYMEAAEDGELEDRNESIDWSTVTEDGYLPEQRQEDLDPYSVRFVNPWSRRGFDPIEGESITLDLRK
jgi:hypothetical protein